MSVPQIDFFYIQEIVRDFALSHYFNIFSHTLKKQFSKNFKFVLINLHNLLERACNHIKLHMF